MSLISILVTLIVIGILVYLVNEFVPMDARYKKLFNIIAIVATIIWLVMKLLPGFVI